MKKPSLSSNFTVEDIQKLREYNSERRKNMTTEELKEDIRKFADRFKGDTRRIRSNRKSIER